MTALSEEQLERNREIVLACIASAEAIPPLEPDDQPSANLPKVSPKPSRSGGRRKQPPVGGAELNRQLARFPLTDLGNVERFRERCRDKFLHNDGLGWLVWDGKRWLRDGAPQAVKVAEHDTVRAIQDEAKSLRDTEEDFEAKRDRTGKPIMYSDLVGAWGRTSESASRIGCISGRAQPYFHVSTAELDADPFAINLLNGTLKVRPRDDGDYISIHPHDPADKITKLAPVEYCADALCPIYDEFLAFVQPDPDSRCFLHQWGGLSLTGDTSEQMLTFHWGKGKNGKSTLFNAWAIVAGDYGKSIPIETFLNEGRSRAAGQPTPDLAMLHGVRFLRTSEPERGAKLAEALIKLATGGEPMSVRHLNKEFFELLPQFKLTMSGNYRPKIGGTDEGMWRRVRLVPWNVTVPPEKRDKDFGKKLELEAPGILNRLLDGLRDWMDNGMSDPAEVAAATADYRRDSDPLGRFLDACVAIVEGERVQSSHLHEVFVAWAKANGAAEWTNKGLTAAMKERGFINRHSNAMWWLDLKLSKSARDFDRDAPPDTS